MYRPRTLPVPVPAGVCVYVPTHRLSALPVNVTFDAVRVVLPVVIVHEDAGAAAWHALVDAAGVSAPKPVPGVPPVVAGWLGETDATVVLSPFHVASISACENENVGAAPARCSTMVWKNSST